MSVPYRERVAYKLNGIPLGLRTALYRQSREEDTSYANLIGAKLAASYGLDFEASDRGHANGPPEDTLLLRLPSTVWEAVKASADERGLSFRSVILEAIAESFGLEPPAPTTVNPKRRPGRPKHGRPRGRKGRT